MVTWFSKETKTSTDSSGQMATNILYLQSHPEHNKGGGWQENITLYNYVQLHTKVMINCVVTHGGFWLPPAKR